MQIKKGKMIMKKRFGFTIAELLIVIGIIGVISALVMPHITKAYQKQIAVTRLKKSYAIIQNAIRQEEAISGEVMNWWPEWDYDITAWYRQDINAAIQNHILPHLNVIEFYPREGVSGTILMTLCGNENGYTWLNGLNISTAGDRTYSSFKLADGTCIGIGSYSYGNDQQLKNVLIDINGSDTKPNISGIDLFHFILNDKGQLIPYGQDWTDADLTNKSKFNACTTNYPACGGAVCAAKIMRDGWKIKDDYPWTWRK